MVTDIFAPPGDGYQFLGSTWYPVDLSRARQSKDWLIGEFRGQVGMFASVHAADEPDMPEVRYPRVDVALDTMEARIKAQRETVLDSASAT